VLFAMVTANEAVEAHDFAVLARGVAAHVWTFKILQHYSMRVAERWSVRSEGRWSGPD
jgi:hypothetical protein